MSRQLVVLIIGLPGTGKSTIAKRVCQLIAPVAYLSTEIVRSKLYGISNEPEDRDFSPTELEQTYRAISVAAFAALDAGGSVVIDGVFRSIAQREIVEDIVRSRGCEFIKLFITCPISDSICRSMRRKVPGTISPAGPLTIRNIADNYDAVDSSFNRIENVDLKRAIALTDGIILGMLSDD